MATPHGASLLGRPPATSHAEIERAAFRLFALRGFDGTTLDAIAGEVGISRRTLLRYYDSKNDIPWGRFAETLDGFRATLAAMPDDLPLHQAVHAAVLAFNRFDLDAHPSHRERMQLILTTPALQAHSVLRYGEWRRVIAEYVARPPRRRGRRPAAAHRRSGEPGADAVGLHALARPSRPRPARPARQGHGGTAGLPRIGLTGR